jgi:branched-chain amino acid transport system permease protein
MVITGGKGTLAGPIVGGVIFGMLPEVLRSFAIVPELQWVLFGVLMILIVFLLPQGIVPTVSAWWAQRRRAPAHSEPPVEVAPGARR